MSLDEEGFTMAHLWMKCGAAGDWGILPLDLGARYLLTGSAAQPVTQDPSVASTAGAVLMSLNGPRGAAWILISSQGQHAPRVNGDLHGVKLLSDRDEVRMHRVRLFFSSESLAQVEPIPAANTHSGKCPRCTRGFEPGQLSVKCPKCGIWSHQFEGGDGIEGRKCWTYAPGCASCGHPTALDAGYAWTPEELG